ncbi:hypothetical protein BSF38_00008 [Paludisphaera borealis]|uniref:Response regulatory domain-containing protein n=2 Tax=Paludisphaera borealis TaxID=1387353 RepID=A0A1U7CI31_9BACT|nr:hypothetical protein BSF38_00008 [Paludisphaera borealis]
MFVLLVEDEDDFIDELRQVFLELAPSAEIQVARSRSSAMKLIDKVFFDLIVLDLKIPTIDGALDAEPEHGHAVFAKAQSVAPGTPVFVLTGSPVEDFIQPMLSKQQQVDIWGQGQKVGNLTFLQKFNFERCPENLRPIVDGISGLADVELDRQGCDLSTPNDRLIRIFAKLNGGAFCRVTKLSGGLSTAVVLRLHLTDPSGALIYDAIAKLGSADVVREEGEKFDKLVARLDPSATPRKLATLEFGAGSQAGNFYSLARGFDVSAFDVALWAEPRAAGAILAVEQATKPWNDGVAQSRRTIREIRQRVLSDENAARLAAAHRIKWADELEAKIIQTKWAYIHGDFHGLNILASDQGAVVIIDYGDVGDGPASLDPITLELSLIFHPQGPFHPQRADRVNWPTTEQAMRWGDLDFYLAGCPAAEFIRECRAWSERVAVGKREISACAYSYLLRQLKYNDVDKALALALLTGVYAHFNST